jgi:hypothetical protein
VEEGEQLTTALLCYTSPVQFEEPKLHNMKCTRKKEKLDNIIKIGKHEIERVQEFKYLGTQDIMKEEINSRIKQGNIAFYANKNLLGNKLLTRKAKIKL